MLGINFTIVLIVAVVLCIKKYKQYDIFDPDSGNIDNDKSFVDNQISVYFYEDVTFRKVKKFVRKINDKIDEYEDEESIISSYTITLDKTFKTEDDVYEYCDILLDKYDILESCDSNSIIYLDDMVSIQ